MEINGRKIGNGHSPYIIAEMASTHGGSLHKAKVIIEEAKRAGADAVKLQTYTPECMTLDTDDERFVVKNGLWKGKKLFDLYKEAQTPLSWHEPLFLHAKSLGITIFSSVFDKSGIDLLESLGCPAYKIASFEITDTELIKYAASKGKPMIISTGMASDMEIEDAVSASFGTYGIPLALLYCVSGYPTPVNEINLKRISIMKKQFCINIGISDHTTGVSVPCLAVAEGACIIEKHIKHSCEDRTPDSAFSLTPDDFYAMVCAARDAFEITHNPRQSESEEGNRRFRRSLYAAVDVPRGTFLTKKMVVPLRPAIGLPASALSLLVGRQARIDISRGGPLTLDQLV